MRLKPGRRWCWVMCFAAMSWFAGCEKDAELEPAGAEDDHTWEPTAEQVAVGYLGETVEFRLYACGKDCSVVGEPQPTEFQYEQTSTEMWRSVSLPIPQNLGPGKHNVKLRLKDTDYGEATVTVEFEITKAFFDGDTCKNAQCSYDSTMEGLTVVAPAGTRVKLDGVEKTVEDGQVLFPIDGMANLKAYEEGDASAGDKKASLELTLPDGQTLQTEAQVAWHGDYLLWLYKKLDASEPGTATPVPGESEAPDKPRAIRVYPPGGRGARMLSQKTLTHPSMVDEVAYFEKRESEKSCGTYVNKEWGTRYQSFITMSDYVIDVYDRRTGKKEVSHTLKGERPKCPKSVAEPPQGQSKVYAASGSAPEETEVFEFLKSRLAETP